MAVKFREGIGGEEEGREDWLVVAVAPREFLMDTEESLLEGIRRPDSIKVLTVDLKRWPEEEDREEEEDEEESLDEDDDSVESPPLCPTRTRFFRRTLGDSREGERYTGLL